MSTYRHVPRAVAAERKMLKTSMRTLEQHLDAHRVASARMERALTHIRTLAEEGEAASGDARWSEIIGIVTRTLEAV